MLPIFGTLLSNVLKIDTVREISLIDIFDISGIHET